MNRPSNIIFGIVNLNNFFVLVDARRSSGDKDVDNCNFFFVSLQNRNYIGSPQISFDDNHSDYVISLQSVGQKPESQTDTYENGKSLAMERKATKKRIKMLRWLKKAIVDKGQDSVMVIGDIYKVVGPDNHVKLWCTIGDRQLYCYFRVTDEKPECVIPLDNCFAVPSSVNVGKKYAFDIEKDGVKLMTFAANSSKERARWMEIIKTKRGMISLAEVDDESGEEAAGSGTSEEDEDDDDHEYVKGTLSVLRSFF